MKLSDIMSLLRTHGYRITPQRKALLKVISESRDRFTPADIYRRARRISPAIGVVTVYRMLEALDGLGLICRMHGADECRTYLMRRPSGHHHHLICVSCGKVVDVTSCDMSTLEDQLASDTGFAISGHVLEFQGLCHACLLAGARARLEVPAKHNGGAGAA